MPDGDGNSQSIYISDASVQAALDTFRFTATKKSFQAICTLSIVDEWLINPDVPPIDRAREVAVQELLTSIVKQQLEQQLRILNVDQLNLPETRVDALELIQNLSTPHASTLNDWLFLYFHYIRSDLDISLEQFADAISLDPRSVRRNRKKIITRFKQLIISKEIAVRQKYRKQRLLTTLPFKNSPFVGYQSEIEQLHHLLEADTCRRIIVAGDSGLGKTRFIQKILRDLIEDDCLESIIWINKPPSVQYIYDRLYEELIPENTALAIRQIMFEYRTVIVLDQINRLQNSAEWEVLLNDLSYGLVFISTSTYLRLEIGDVYVQMRPLTKEESYEFIDISIQFDTDVVVKRVLDKIDTIYNFAKGYPSLLLYAVKRVRISDFRFSQKLPLKSMVTIFNNLADVHKHIWCLLALLSTDGIRQDNMNVLLNKLGATLAPLLELYIVLPDNDRYTLTHQAKLFIFKSIEKETFAVSLSGLFDVLSSMQVALSDRLIHIYEHILLNDSNLLGQQHKQDWLTQLWERGVEQGHFAIWGELLREYAKYEDLSLQLGYGICLRRLSRFSEAESVFISAIQICGIKGEFEIQHSLLIELAVLFRLQGNYDKALAHLERATTLLTKHESVRLYQKLYREYVQIEVDRKSASTALAYLRYIQSDLLRLHFLCEIQYLHSDYKASQSNVLDLLRRSPENSTPDLYMLLSRCYQALEKYHDSAEYITIALNYFDKQHDVYGKARALCNLGSLLIHSKDYKQAQELLTEAKDIQIRLNDRVGLQVTQHNINHLIELLAQK